MIVSITLPTERFQLDLKETLSFYIHIQTATKIATFWQVTFAVAESY